MAEAQTTATGISTAPLLTRQETHNSLFGGGARTFTALSIFFGLFAGLREASMIVRESAARELDYWRDNRRYSFLVVVIDTTWNLAFVVVSIVMLLWTAREQPNVTVRAWICVYAVQCAVHVVLVWLEYRRRNRRAATASSGLSDSDRSSFVDSRGSDVISASKRCDTYNTIIQYLWWLVAFCWLIPNFDMHSAPRLFWLTVTFMAIDVFLAVIDVLKGLIRGLAVCFCLPFIMNFLYFMDDEGGAGASEEEIENLSKYKFVVSNDEAPLNIGGRIVPFETNSPDFSHERVVQFEDADCCICLCVYENGTKLHLLPCNHHFHVVCILKWLNISRNCPLCKHTIGSSEQV